MYNRNRLFSPNTSSKIDLKLYEQRLMQLQEKIADAKKLAEQNNKLLLLILGEEHKTEHSRHVILNILDSCRDEFGMSDVAIEYDNLESFYHAAKTREKEGYNSAVYLEYINKEIWNPIPVDKYYSLVTGSDSKLEIRNKGIIEELLSDKVVKDLAFITGANHIAGLLKDEKLLEQKFEVVTVNTYYNPMYVMYPFAVEYRLIMEEENTFQFTEKGIMKK